MPESIEAALQAAARALASAGVDGARADARVLLAHVLGKDRAWILSHAGDALAAASATQLLHLVRRRIAGEPVAYLTGTREFWSLPFRVDPRVLVPRPESEHLVETVLARCALSAPLVVDVGAGSGCLGLAIAHEKPAARILALDVRREALAVALLNARRLGLDGRFSAVCGDALSAIGSGVDVVVSNPPYVRLDDWPAVPPHVRNHEPVHALTCGPDDLEVTRRIIREAPRVLRPGGLLVVEIDPRRAESVAELLSGPAWCRHGNRQDLAGRDRVAWAETVARP